MEKGKITIAYMQEYLKMKDHNPEIKEIYFMKLAEEVGELSRAMLKNNRPSEDGSIIGTIDEELHDILYYTLAIANCYGIDMEKIIPIKEKINNDRYNKGIVFNPPK